MQKARSQEPLVSREQGAGSREQGEERELLDLKKLPVPLQLGFKPRPSKSKGTHSVNKNPHLLIRWGGSIMP
jgi:hypothetical protein